MDDIVRPTASPHLGSESEAANAPADAAFRVRGHHVNDRNEGRLAYERHLARKMIL